MKQWWPLFVVVLAAAAVWHWRKKIGPQIGGKLGAFLSGVPLPQIVQTADGPVTVAPPMRSIANTSVAELQRTGSARGKAAANSARAAAGLPPLYS